MWTITFTENHGFLGIFLLASWPNAAFDMCGMACGWLEVPFWTFFGATAVGKGFVKVTLQSVVCIGVFGRDLFALVVSALERADVLSLGLGAHATALRRKVMSKFEAQARMSAAELLGATSSLDAKAFAVKYCAIAGQCGKRVGGVFADADEHATALATATRVVDYWDLPKGGGDGVLELAELELAQSATDGKLSLASLDAGDGGLISIGTAWNTLLAALVGFFVLSIVDQLAKGRQAELDEARLNEAEAELRGKKGR